MPTADRSCLLPERRFGGGRILRCLMITLRLGAVASGANAGLFQSYLDPKIKQQPVSQVAGIGETATFKVVMETEPEQKYIDRGYRYYDSTFQWIKDGARVEGATTTTLTIKHAQPSDAGVYFLALNWERNRATSAIVTLAVVASAPPAIAAHPTGGTFQRDQSVTLRVVASGAPAPRFQWFKDGRELAGATADSLTFSRVQTADTGSYEARVANPFGTLQSRSAVITVIDPLVTGGPGAPGIVSEPQSLVVRAGEPATFDVSAVGAGVTYQWFRHGVALAGATTPVLTFANAAVADMGCYSVRASNAAGTTESQCVALAVVSSGSSRVVNLSARGYVPREGNLTVGFSLRGEGPKSLLLRAAGPALGTMGIDDFLPDPRLAWQAAGVAAVVRTNDNWSDPAEGDGVAAATAAVGALPFAPGSRDAATLAQPAAAEGRTFTLQVTAADSATEGTVLAELYDPEGTEAAVRLAGVSILATVGAGDHVLTPRFTVAGTGPKRLLIRAVGPGLAALGVAGTMSDPELSVTPAGGNTPVARNTDWANNADIRAAAASVGAFALAPDGRDAAVVVSLPPGAYTVAVTGAGGSSGLVLLEIYDLDP